jgi:hypothetical protein
MIKCPSCQAEYNPIATDLPDGTYTETCTNIKCSGTFSYVIEDGKVKEWEPPKNVNVAVKE